MTLHEANQILSRVDCRDPEAVAEALKERARAIAEFAASAPKELLDETLAAGEAFRDRLEMTQIEARREVDRMKRLTRGLESTLSEHQADHIKCFG
jgi:hypothetical protein